ncbi:hypothetical protein BC938DRAFT_484231 [Jimgerdemannia flammicorona]|uniref:Protein Lines N-terminal domain-containing protein n=1 Tax=Jimgerdemannia flammicorona TaxID=994334 RepID=A0A433QVE2_9FUNG|nr:hypothetical protein BC938DRAFT_484231 [Jimgerdemannia flammicorona]
MDTLATNNPLQLSIALTRIATIFENPNNETTYQTYQQLLQRHQELVSLLHWSSINHAQHLPYQRFTPSSRSSIHLIAYHDDHIEEFTNTLQPIAPLLADQFHNLLHPLSTPLSTTRAAALELFHAVLKSFRKTFRATSESQDVPCDLSQRSAAYSLVVRILGRDPTAWIRLLLGLQDVMILIPLIVFLVDIVKIHTLLPSDKTSREEERDDYIFFRESIEGIVQVVVQNLEQVVVIFVCQISDHISSMMGSKHIVITRKLLSIQINLHPYTVRLHHHLTPATLAMICAPDRCEFCHAPPPTTANDKANAGFDRECVRRVVHVYVACALSVLQGMEGHGVWSAKEANERRERLRELYAGWARVAELWADISQIPQSHLHDLLFDLYGNNDGDLVDLQLQVVRIATLSKKLLAREGYSAQRLVCMEELCYNVDGRDEDGYVSCGPHDLLLHLLHKTGFDHTILLDFLISAETPSFLEFLLLYLRYLEHDLPAFRTCCAKLASKESESEEEKEREEDEDESEDEDKDEDVDMDEEEGAERAVVGRVVRVLARLRSAVGARGFPYNAASLVKRLTVVEGLLDEAGDHYGVSRSAAKH